MNKVKCFFRKNAKALVAVAGTAVVTVFTAVSHHAVDPAVVLPFEPLVVAAIVYAVPNKDCEA